MKLKNGTSIPDGFILTVVFVGFMVLVGVFTCGPDLKDHSSSQPAPDYTPRKSGSQGVADFVDTMVVYDPSNSMWDSCRFDGTTLRVSVDDLWYTRPIHERERWAKTLWNVWVVVGDQPNPKVAVYDSWAKKLASVSAGGTVELEERQ